MMRWHAGATPSLLAASATALRLPSATAMLQSGRLVVDGVLASAHSDWLLDDVMPAWAVHLLPHIYQVNNAGPAPEAL